MGEAGYNHPESAPVPEVNAGLLHKSFRFDELLRVVRAGMAPNSNAE